MGSAASIKTRTNSKQLICPKNYSQKDFNKILLLFDKLDKSGDMIIDEDELKVLTAHHIKNRKMLLNLKKKKNIQNKEKMLLDLKLKYDKAVLKCKTDTQFLNNDIDVEIDNLTNMSCKDKYILFKSKFTNKDGEINFDLFFNYMKNKTTDISNIKWRVNDINVEIISPNWKSRKSY